MAVGGCGSSHPQRIAETTARARRRRPARYRDGDLVIGEFLDSSQELLVRTPGHGIMIEVPTQEREHWYHGADNLCDFLQRYASHLGQKSWARRRPDAGTWHGRVGRSGVASVG